MQVDDEEHVVVKHLHQYLRALLHVRLSDQRRDTQHTVHFEDTDDVQYHIASHWVVQQRQQIDPKSDRQDVVGEDLVGAFNFLAETVLIGGAQVDEDVSDVEDVGEHVDGVVVGIQHIFPDGNAHRNKRHRVDGHYDDHVGPALAPWICTRDQVLVSTLTFVHSQPLPLLFDLVLQVVGHQDDSGLGQGELFQLRLVDDRAELRLLTASDLVQTFSLLDKLLFPKVILHIIVRPDFFFKGHQCSQVLVGYF